VSRMTTRKQRVLLSRDQVLEQLQVGEDELEELIDSNRLTEVRIRGHRRFDSDEVNDLAGRSSCWPL
jgi:excisionase family DNA binding protein